jgi:hypothetical protein
MKTWLPEAGMIETKMKPDQIKPEVKVLVTKIIKKQPEKKFSGQNRNLLIPRPP